ncbi:MAG: SLC26A/SulP transporter family protein [Gemmatimonadaceae bacterium]|nr:SLC26A/SulP transporter family protein [Gemmatimonadaceae bacterium]
MATAELPAGSAHSKAGDVWGGLAAMLVALPSSIAFGVLVYSAIGPDQAGAGALAGILGAAALGIVAPLVGGNGGFITAPCAPAAAILSALAAGFAARGDMEPARIVALLGLTALLSALFQLGFGVARVGRLIKFIPYQVVSGYLSGVAVIIAIGQLPKLLGVPKGTALGPMLISPSLWRWQGIVVGLVTIAAVLLAPRLTAKVPAAIIGLAVGVAAYFALALVDSTLLVLEGNKLVIGPITASGSFMDAVGLRASSLLEIRPPDVSLVFSSALTLAVLLSIDTLKTGVVLDTLVRSRHNSNRELLGQGTANLASFFVGGMAGAGTMGATLVNVTSGGRSRWSGVAEGVFVLLAYLVLASLIAWVPIGALAGILLVVAFRMFDRAAFKLLLNPSTRVDFAVILTVIAVAQVELIAASAVGVFLAILLFIRDQARSSVIVNKRDLRSVHSKRRRLLAESEILDAHGTEAVLVQLHGNLFFGTTDKLFNELEPDLGRCRYVLFDMRRVQSMDFTAAHLFEQMKARVADNGGELLLSSMPSGLARSSDIEGYLAQLGLVGSGHGIRLFETRDSAIEWIEDQILRAHGYTEEDEGAALDLNEIEIFSEFDAETIAELSSAVTTTTVPPGGVICRQGDAGDELFLIRRGRVSALLPLETGKRHHVATFCRGDFFGEMAFIDQEPRSATVEAVTAAELFVLSRRRFDEVAIRYPSLAGIIFERLAVAISKRLRSADTELRVLEER